MASTRKEVTTPKKTGTTEKTADKQPTQEKDDTQQYLMMIAEAAYYKAESRGFEPGHEMEDWIEAEKEIMNALDQS